MPRDMNRSQSASITSVSAVRSSILSLFRSVSLQAAAFSSTTEFLSSRKPDAPSCLVLDVRLPGDVSGIEFQAELAKANIRLPIIFITGYGDIPMTVHAMKAGAVEFLTKPFRNQDLLDAVWAALDRDSARRDREQELANLVLAYETLTPRERQIFALVTSGLMNKQIASKLEVAESTVKVHRHNIMQKMGAGSFVALVRVADLLGIRQQEN
jgi:FixJ family two-component response regulator